MNRFARWLAVLVGTTAVGLSVAGCIPGIPKSSDETEEKELEFRYLDGDEDSDNYLLEIRINGPILNTPASAGFFSFDSGVTYAYQLQSLLEEAAEDDRIQGLFVRLSTPGGTVVGSNVIFEAIESYKAATENPVYAYIEGLSA